VEGPEPAEGWRLVEGTGQLRNIRAETGVLRLELKEMPQYVTLGRARVRP